MEEENKKLRRNERREFNDAVRQLVAFVKKRDPRFARRRVEKSQSDSDARLAAERQRAEAKRKKQIAGERYEAAAWTKQDEDGPQWLRDEVAAVARAELEKERNAREVFCPVCRKRFKSQKQWENHERSKQHRAAVQKLKEEMLRDEDLVRSAAEEQEEDERRDGPADEPREMLEAGDSDADADVASSDGADEDEDEDEDATLARVTSRANGTSRGDSKKCFPDDSISDEDAGSAVSSAYGDRVARNKPRKMLKKNRVGKKSEREVTEPIEFDVRRMRIEEDVLDADSFGVRKGCSESESESESEVRLDAIRRDTRFEVLDYEPEDVEEEEDLPERIQPRSLSASDSGDDDAATAAATAVEAAAPAAEARKKSRRAKRGARENARGDASASRVSHGEAFKSTRETKNSEGSTTPLMRCSLCRLTFTSGNALHKHLKQAHAGTHKKKR
jgi:DnaJ family protein A protein 5